MAPHAFSTGDPVTYRPHPDAPTERGVVSSIGTSYVHVLFDGDRHTKACSPSTLVPDLDQRRGDVVHLGASDDGRRPACGDTEPGVLDTTDDRDAVNCTSCLILAPGGHVPDPDLDTRWCPLCQTLAVFDGITCTHCGRP